MTTSEAIQFLVDHPQLGKDSPLAVIERLEDVRQQLCAGPDESCIAPLLDMFGDHMGWGVF